MSPDTPARFPRSPGLLSSRIMLAFQVYSGAFDFPNELIDKIVEIMLTGNPNDTSDRKFASIASLTLSSSRFREIALRRFFHSLHLSGVYQWSQLFKFLTAQGEKAFLWVREVQAGAATLSSDPMRLHSLPNLQTLVISFSQTGVATQQSYLTKIIKLPRPYISNPVSPIGSPLHAPKAFSRLESLTLTALSFIDQALLILVSKNFPYLTSLCLSCTNRLDMDCCWGCLQESASCAIGVSPIPDMFPSVDHLAVGRRIQKLSPVMFVNFLNETFYQNSFATALHPLHKLAHLRLGIFLSNESILTAHFSHIIDHSTHDSVNRDLPFGPESCSLCRTSELLSMVRECELAATKIMAKKLKSLESLSWSTIFTNHPSAQSELDSRVGDPGRRTTRWVLRKDGKLFLRTKPW